EKAKLTQADYETYAAWFARFLYVENTRCEWAKMSAQAEVVGKDLVKGAAERMYGKQMELFNDREDTGTLGALLRQCLISGWFTLVELERARSDAGLREELSQRIESKTIYLLAVKWLVDKSVQNAKEGKRDNFFREYTENKILLLPEAAHLNALRLRLDVENDPASRSIIESQITAEKTRLTEMLKIGDAFIWSEFGQRENNELTIKE
ncbi:MAG: hypothetical protein WCK89_18280, partial [bacterium]